MASAPTLIAPVARFAIGDVVYVATVERSTEKLPCPDCLGSKKWTVQSPAGGEYTTDCPRCQRTYSYRNELPSLDVEHWVGKAAARVITGMEIHAGRPVEYCSSIGGGSSWIVREDSAWLTEAEAQAEADIEAAAKNTTAEQKPEVMSARHFSGLNLDEGRWDKFKNGVWNTQYHAANIVQKAREAVEGDEDSGDTTPSNTEALESLREMFDWDTSYHVENLPFTPLVIAAIASEDPAVKAAADALPDTLKALMTQAWKAAKSEFMA